MWGQFRNGEPTSSSNMYWTYKWYQSEPANLIGARYGEQTAENIFREIVPYCKNAEYFKNYGNEYVFRVMTDPSNLAIIESRTGLKFRERLGS